jgi:hypothetical protein
MTNSGITDRDRYNRFSEDWRFHHKLIWEIPSVASAIFIGILTISYLGLDLLLRAAVLGIGALLVLGLTFSVRKHRFGADLRTHFLEEIGQDKDRFPIRSPEGLDHLNERCERKRRRDRWLIRKSSEVYLIWFMLVASGLLSALCVYEVIRTSYRIGELASKEMPLLLIAENITSTNKEFAEIIERTTTSE